MASSWQEKLTSIGERLSHILQNETHSDVKFVVGSPPDQKTFKVHKLILSTSSNVFSAMFYDAQPEENEVTINEPHIQPATFEIVMKYVYEDSFSVECMGDALNTYLVAEKYNIAHLTNLCVDYIKTHLSAENIHVLFSKPNVIETLELQSECDKILSEKTSVILLSDYFMESPLAMVEHMLCLNCLNIESENKLFEMVLQWAKKETEKRNAIDSDVTLRTVMNKFLPHVRFLSMTVEDFLSGPAGSGILTDSEIASLAENLVTPGRRELPDWCNKGKSRDAVRSFLLKSNHTCIFQQTDLLKTATTSEAYYQGGDCTIVVRKRNLVFRGVTIYAYRVATFKAAESEVSAFDIPSVTFKIATKHQTYHCEASCSYCPGISLLKCILLKPILFKKDVTHVISLRSRTYFFPICSSIVTGNLTMSHEDFEIEWQPASSSVACNNNKKLSIGYSHIREVFYS